MIKNQEKNIIINWFYIVKKFFNNKIYILKQFNNPNIIKLYEIKQTFNNFF